MYLKDISPAQRKADFIRAMMLYQKEGYSPAEVPVTMIEETAQAIKETREAVETATGLPYEEGKEVVKELIAQQQQPGRVSAPAIVPGEVVRQPGPVTIEPFEYPKPSPTSPAAIQVDQLRPYLPYILGGAGVILLLTVLKN